MRVLPDVRAGKPIASKSGVRRIVCCKGCGGEVVNAVVVVRWYMSHSNWHVAEARGDDVQCVGAVLRPVQFVPVL